MSKMGIVSDLTGKVIHEGMEVGAKHTDDIVRSASKIESKVIKESTESAEGALKKGLTKKEKKAAKMAEQNISKQEHKAQQRAEHLESDDVISERANRTTAANRAEYDQYMGKIKDHNVEQISNSKFSESTLKGKRFKSKEGYMQHEVGSGYDNAAKDLGNSESKNPLLEEIRAKHNLGGVEDVTENHIKNERYSAISRTTEDDMRFRDKLAYHKVPTRVVAGGTSLFLASKILGHGGSQSNSELYGQQQQH